MPASVEDSRPDPVPWSVAMDAALYGPGGFYVAGEGAAGHFRTSASGSLSLRAIFADALAVLLERVDTALGRPDPFDLVDIGAGSADVLEAVLESLGQDLRGRVRPVVVEIRPRPAGLSGHVGWRDSVPEMSGLLIANEWLDNVAIDVVVDRGGVEGGPSDGTVSGQGLLLVDPAGAESVGPAPSAPEVAWLARWWGNGARREIGLHRDRAWAGAVSRVHRGLAVAVDYGHVAAERPPYGTLTGFRLGRETGPIPDGSRDLTAHVAIDSVAAAGEAAAIAAGRSVRTMLADQRAALGRLGVSGRRPDYANDPGRYAAALQRASAEAELIDQAGLGGFTWLLHGIDLDVDLTTLLA